MKIAISAFEKSANLHLRYLLPHLKYKPIGIFDKSLGDPLVDLQELAVMGFVDAAKKLPFFLQLKKEMVKLAKEADKVLLIDASGFNLPLAKAIKKEYPNKEIIYYILPQAWAWRRGRIKTIEKYVDKALSILPFEKKYYSPNYNIKYVGHPLLDEIKTFKETPTKSDKVVFMPGSRRAEIQSLMPIFKEVRKAIDKEALLVIPQNFDLTIYGDISDFTVTHDAHKALYEAEFGFICSGTATLEASLIGTPLALCYIAKPLDYFLAKQFAKIDRAGLANIMLGDMHPEFLQESVTKENLLQAYKNANPKEFLQKSKKLRQYLAHGSAAEAAREINA
ncbi:lipid-A-disaccharide synthase [Nitratiruptor tergarcus]|uniref:Lipid-A-disaccharide synthase n=1 Tax=Nitratiruptor tergarcus DSM 16512 TaxID=1069081 RepID=A0A1W1WUN4_9BACT|nr:lipid-A-disaccharide synthase [Nitratiruptor tergarcus]SMC10028.1 lipid-A-disaccharide synthase [Nitratiruptor tergarcus DSM 16512]